MSEGYLTAQSTQPLKVRGVAGMSAHVEQFALEEEEVYYTDTVPNWNSQFTVVTNTSIQVVI
jgi:hypothetical protein